MITTIMTAEEIIREYKSDYEKCLKPRLSSLASRKTHDLKLSKGKWVLVKEDLEVRSTTGNTYKIKCKLRWDKRRGVGWSIVTYLIIPDSRTGKKVAFLLSSSFPIKLSSSFLHKLKTPLSDFLKNGVDWTIMKKDDLRYIDFGEEFGIGDWESGVFVLHYLIKDWEDLILDIKLEDTSDQVKKSEIDLAWEAYLSGNL